MNTIGISFQLDLTIIQTAMGFPDLPTTEAYLTSLIQADIAERVYQVQQKSNAQSAIATLKTAITVTYT